MVESSIVEKRPSSPLEKLEVLHTGEEAFQEIMRCLRQARKNVEIRCFVWRDDFTGNMAAREFLDAADRGVQITIHKDRVGAIYEHFDPNMHSFLHKKLSLGDRMKLEFLCFVYDHGRPRAQGFNPLAQRICDHPNITIRHDEKLHSHSKVFVFDDETLFIGGMGIGDDFRSEWVDMMVQLNDRRLVRRYRERLEGGLSRELERPVDFLVNARHGDGSRSFHVLETRLEAMGSVRESLVMEMAYLGDRRITDGLVELVGRGVEVTLLVSAQANILNDLNLWTFDSLLKETGSPKNLRLYLHPRMVHTKLMIFDGRLVQIGSTNCTALSHDAFEETDLWVEDPDLARHLTGLVEDHAEVARRVTGRSPFDPVYGILEWLFQKSGWYDKKH
jgi:cardiolipin synthase